MVSGWLPGPQTAALSLPVFNRIEGRNMIKKLIDRDKESLKWKTKAAYWIEAKKKEFIHYFPFEHRCPATS